MLRESAAAAAEVFSTLLFVHGERRAACALGKLGFNLESISK